MNIFLSRALITLGAVLGVLGQTTLVAAQQHQDAHAYAYWSFSGGAGFWNVDQRVRVERRAHATYWAQYWTWSGAANGGYVGIQTDGNRLDGTRGDTAIFSLWDASAARGPSCIAFSGEGSGFSCRIAYPIELDRWYRLRVWRLEADDSGQWWGAWIRDETTGHESHLGDIRVARDRTLMAPPMNFSEYYGQQVACDAVPFSRAAWAPPAANYQEADRYEFSAHYSGHTLGACSSGSVGPWSFGMVAGARIDLGMHAPGWLKPAETLASGQGLASRSGQYVLQMQADGNLVQYGPQGPLFSTATSGQGHRLDMQHDGNAVLYAPDGRALWSTRTNGHRGAALSVQDDGNIVVYAADKATPLWAAH